MVDPTVHALVAMGALLCFVVAGALVLPQAPELHGERWFKWILVRTLAPERVAWHPAGRYAERKVLHPDLAPPDGKPAVGETELLRELRQLPDPAARWRHLRAHARELLVDDALPRHLDPSRWLGEGWAGEGCAALEARNGLRWLAVDGGAGGDLPGDRVGWMDGVEAVGAMDAWRAIVATCADAPGLWDALVVVAGRVRVLAETAAVEGVRAGLSQKVEGAPVEARFLVAADGPGAPVLLRALRADATLRDRVVVVLSVHGWVMGHPDRADFVGEAACRDWMGAWFRHEHLDVEPVRRVPYLCVAWMDEAATTRIDGVPVAHTRFPEPAFVGTGQLMSPMEPPCPLVADLGVVDREVQLAELAPALRMVAVLAALLTA